MKQQFFLGISKEGFHRVAYTQWGECNNQVPLICVHGLTRNGRDFDFIAKALSEHGKCVVCPDMVGRGDSDYLQNSQNYQILQYISDITALIARMNTEKVDWLGVSMGGIIGMVLASLPKNPISRLIIDDVGALIPSSALARLGKYVGANPKFSSMNEATNYLKTIHATFGNLTEEQWQHLTLHSIRQSGDGSYVLKIDPQIKISLPKIKIILQMLRHPLKTVTGKLFDVDLWEFWQKITCPTLIIRGEDSDLLPQNVAEKMQQMRHNVELVTIPKVGHAPMLMSPQQINIVTSWLARTEN